MKKSFFSVPRTLPLHALTTFLIGVGCVWPLSLSLGLTAPLSLSVGCCALVGAGVCPAGLPAASACAGISAAAAVLCGVRPQPSRTDECRRRRADASLNGHALALAAYSRALSCCFRSSLRASARRFPEASRLFSRWRCWKSRCCSSSRFSARRSVRFRSCPLILALLLSGCAPAFRQSGSSPWQRRHWAFTRC